MNKKLSFTTRTIHSGYDASLNEGSLNPPVYMTSTYCFDNVEQGAARFAGETTGHVYSRISNPTQAVLETRLADLEDAEACLATASGMGAITAAIWTLVHPGDTVIADKTLYGCTFSYFQHGLTRFAVSLGDAETLCQHPASMTHSTYAPEERAEHDISEGLVRLSVGLEDVDDIYADLEQALAGV